MKLHQSSFCTAGAVFGDDLDCSVDSRTINSTAPPCSGRSSMAATLPLSCFTLEDSLKLLHAKRTQKHLFCQQRRCLTLGSGFHQVIVRLKILAYCSQNNYHPFPRSIHITSTQLTSHSQSWFFSSQELSYFNARFNSWEAQDCDTV